MIEQLFNKIYVRAIIGIVLGIPTTSLALIFGVHGLILGYAGVKELKIFMLLIGLVTILGWIGIIGAWIRVFVSSNEATIKLQRYTRFMLYCGLAACLSLNIWALVTKDLIEGILYFGPLLIGGVLFLLATPVRSNKVLTSQHPAAGTTKSDIL